MDIDEKIAKNWHKIIKRILDLPFDETPKVVPLSAPAKALFKEWYDKQADQKNCDGIRIAKWDKMKYIKWHCERFRKFGLAIYLELMLNQQID